MTGALKLMLGRFAGAWKLGGRPLCRLACALLDCWTPGGGAIPGAEDMPGGGPEYIGQRRNSMAQLGIPNLDQVEEPCQARRWIPGSRHSSGEARKGFLLRD